MSKDTSGPAFPGQYDHGHTIESWTGMTLRDYFAAKVMAAQIVAIGAPIPQKIELETIAKRSYEIAEAMLKAREA